MNYSENLIEAYYKAVGDAHVDLMAEELDGQRAFSQDVQLPDSLEIWFKDYYGKIKRSTKVKIVRQKSLMYGTRAAAALFLILLISGVTTFSVDAWRVRFLNLFMEDHGQYTEVSVGEVVEDVYGVLISQSNLIEPGEYYPSYVPSGFVLNKVDRFGDIRRLEFIVDDAVITLLEASLEGNTQLDTEGAKVTEIEIDGYKGLIIVKAGHTMIYWYNAEYAYTLLGEFDTNELFKMAQSLKKK